MARAFHFRKDTNPMTAQRSPVSLDEARLLANVNERAQRLFEDGYRIRCLDANRYLVRSQPGATYTVDRLENTCSCPFFEKHGGRYPCKHTLGWRKLLLTQRAAIARLSARWEAVEREASIEQVLQSATRVLQQRLEVPTCP